MNKRLNLNITSAYPKTAIITHNYEQREAIEAAMRSEYPELMELWKPGELAGCDAYREYESCIALHIYDDEMDCVQVADEEYWREKGYIILEFDSLLEEPVDFGELCCSACGDINQFLMQEG